MADRSPRTRRPPTRCCRSYNVVRLLLFVVSPALLAVHALTLDCFKSSHSYHTNLQRRTFISILATTITTVPNVWADDSINSISPDYENRDRMGNQQAVIRDDYWYITGKLPPRKLQSPLKGDDPQWNAFGSCTTSESTGSNSCTYVSLGQRRAAYTKYASSIRYGADDYQTLGSILLSIQKSSLQPISILQPFWEEAASLLKPSQPSAPVDAELKMVLLATALLTSPNFPGPSRELLVARFYANEVRFAHREIYTAVQGQDIQRAVVAWEFGRDSWNSYFQAIARAIVPKVGNPFNAIA
jgi:hypothetical protein